MAHDEHFLSRLSRVDDARVELAMSLYHDPGLVRAVLERSELPPGAERCALALGPEDRGPYVVLARSGHFVTCLGEGMRTSDLPIISLAKLESIATRVETLRERMEIAKRTAPDQSHEARLVHRITTAGPAWSREEFITALTWMPVVASAWYKRFIEYVRTVDKGLPTLARGDGPLGLREGLAKVVAEAAWGLLHLGTLLFADERVMKTTLADSGARAWAVALATIPFDHFEHSGGAIRFIHGLARIGRPMADLFKSSGDEPSRWLVLQGVARAFPELETELLDLLDREAPDQPKHRGYDVVVESAISLGRTVATRRLVDAHYEPLFPNAEDVPEELAVPMLASLDLGVDAHNLVSYILFPMIAAARGPAEKLYLPAEYAKHLWAPSLTTTGLSLAERWRKRFVTREPAQRKDEPGRNAPCPCGSGKKYKKCCAGKTPPG